MTWKSEGFISASVADSLWYLGHVPLPLSASVSPSVKVALKQAQAERILTMLMETQAASFCQQCRLPAACGGSWEEAPGHSPLEREVQFAPQCDLQQAVAQDLQGDLGSFGIFYDQPVRGMEVAQPGEASVECVCSV